MVYGSCLQAGGGAGYGLGQERGLPKIPYELMQTYVQGVSLECLGIHSHTQVQTGTWTVTQVRR